jgi:hypothetical protein
MSYPCEQPASPSLAARPLTHAIGSAIDAARSFLDRAQHGRRDAWLASAAELGDLERRMRSIEADD